MPPVGFVRGQKTIEQPIDLDTVIERYDVEALKFIRANKDRPFFLFFSHTYPHVPLAASKKFRGTSECGLYGDAVQEIDASTGKVLELLKELKLDEKTIVIFTSDNGPWLAKGEAGGSAFPL